MGLLSTIAGAGSAAAGYDIAKDIRRSGERAAQDMRALGDRLQGDTAFKGYGVTTGLGSSRVGPDGSFNLGVGQDASLANKANAGFSNAMSGFDMSNQMAVLNSANPEADAARGGFMSGMSGLGGQQQNALAASQQAMRNAMQGTAGREQDIYNRAMAMQQPGLDAQRAALEAREFAQGRGGVRGSQFGGSGEDAAMARAQAQAQNQASFQAMNQAQQEMMNQGNLASQFGQLGQNAAATQGNIASQLGQMGNQNAMLGQNAAGLLNQAAIGQGNLANQAYTNSFLPMEMQMQAAQLGQGTGSMAQTGQLSGANLAAQLGLGGIQTQVNADMAGSQLFADLFGAGMNALGGATEEGLFAQLFG